MIWPAGQQLRDGQYEIIRRLGGGGFGLTYLAREKSLDRDVVIKTPNRDLEDDSEYEKFVRRFSQEGQKLARVSHPHIVKVWDFFMEGKMPCLVMEYVNGETLTAVIKRCGALPEAEAVQHIQQVAEALCEVHQAGLVHCDAHPGNIMIRSGGDAILIDFGTAKSILPTTQTSATTAWNESYAPYEQREGRYDPTVDIYTLSASLYFTVTGQKPVDSLTRKMRAIENKTDPLIEPKQHCRDLSRQLNRAIVVGMALEPHNRPPSMQNWLRKLDRNLELSKALEKEDFSKIHLYQRLPIASLFVLAVAYVLLGLLIGSFSLTLKSWLWTLGLTVVWIGGIVFIDQKPFGELAVGVPLIASTTSLVWMVEGTGAGLGVLIGFLEYSMTRNKTPGCAGVMGSLLWTGLGALIGSAVTGKPWAWKAAILAIGCFMWILIVGAFGLTATQKMELSFSRIKVWLALTLSAVFGLLTGTLIGWGLQSLKIVSLKLV